MLGVSGKYRLDQRLGGGGMAEVFLAQAVGAEGFSRKVAIKRVLPGFSDNQAFAKMFIDEAQISAQLVHPNIVSVLDFDRDAENRLGRGLPSGLPARLPGASTAETVSAGISH